MPIIAPIRPPNFPTFNLPNFGPVISNAISPPTSLTPRIDPNILKAKLAAVGLGETGAPTPGTTTPEGTASVTDAAGGHWDIPNYEALLQGDPTYLGTLAQISAAGDAAGRERAMAVRRAIAQFGGAPAGWSSGFGDVDEAALAAARSNPNSTLAQLEKVRSTSRADLAAALGARGMLHSGALTGGEQAIQSRYEGAQQEATQRLLDALSGYEGSYAEGVRQSELQRLDALAAAGERVRAYNPARWVLDKAANAPGSTAGGPAAGGAGGGGGTPPVAPPPIGTTFLDPWYGDSPAIDPRILTGLGTWAPAPTTAQQRLLMGRLQRAGG